MLEVRSTSIGLKKYLVFVFIALSLYLFFLLLILVFFLSHTRTDNDVASKQEHHFDYQFIEVNPFFEEESSHTITGFITLPQSLEFEEDYVSYLNEETGSMIITNFGGSKYSCTGSCYCNEHDDDSFRRTMNRNILSKSLVVLFSAFSTTMAYKIAHDTFLEQCQQKHSLVCRSENIKSEVDECSEESQKEEETRKDGNSGNKYMCKGYCVELQDHPVLLEIGHREIGLCKNLKIEKVLELNLSKEDVQERNPEELRITAIYKFMTEILLEFCTKNSRVSFNVLPKASQHSTIHDLGVYEMMYETSQGDANLKRMIDANKDIIENGLTFCAGLEKGQEDITYEKVAAMKHIHCIES